MSDEGLLARDSRRRRFDVDRSPLRSLDEWSIVMERRAHWDDDLMTAVLRKLPRVVTSYDDIYPLIAAIEDHGIVIGSRKADYVKPFLDRAEFAERQVQRVRDAVEVASAEIVDLIERALDGPR